MKLLQEPLADVFFSFFLYFALHSLCVDMKDETEPPSVQGRL